LLEEVSWQLKPQLFARSWIKDNQRAGARTFRLSGVMHTDARALKQLARVREHMPAACFIDVKVNRLLANRTLGSQWMKSTSSQELYEFGHPNQQVPHYPLRSTARLDNSSIAAK
jgi:hypothetical protein